MIERFNALAHRKNLDFEVWFNDRKSYNRSWDVHQSSWDFPYHYLSKISFGKFNIHLPLKLFSEKET